MATFKPFKALRPKPEFAADIASRPYDVLNAAEAKDEAKGNNLSFLRVIKPEIELSEEIDPYNQKVYDKGLENLKKLSSEGYLIKEQKASYYVYRLTMEGREQTGIVGCCDYQEYYDGRIKKHELTRTAKENDRVRHVETQNANAEPVFFSYRGVQNINLLIEKIVTFEPVYNFVAEDEIKHELWIVNDDKDISLIEFEFNSVPDLYVADGHHRTAAAARVGQKKKQDKNAVKSSNENQNLKEEKDSQKIDSDNEIQSKQTEASE